MPITEPWSKKHKQVTRASAGGVPFSLSNSYAQPLMHRELVELSLARGDRAIVDEYNDHALGYTPNGGSLDLREEIAKIYGPAITADHVLVFSGAQVALQTAAFALARDSHSIVFTPGYQSSVETPFHAGSEVTQITRKASNNWQIDLREVEEAIQKNTRYLLLNEPYNPAGTLMNRETQVQLAEIAERHGIYILSDEVYRLLEHDPRDRLPPMADIYRRGLSLGALSKPWGGCGVTIGWLAFQDLSIKQQLVDMQYFGTACPARSSELQAVMTLRASEPILKKNMAIIRRNFALLDEFMKRYSDLFGWVRPKAGAVAFICFKGPLSSEQFGQKLAEAGISMKPAYCFTDTVRKENDYFRVGYGEEAVPKALEALAAFVEENKDSWRRSRL